LSGDILREEEVATRTINHGLAEKISTLGTCVKSGTTTTSSFYRTWGQSLREQSSGDMTNPSQHLRQMPTGDTRKANR